MRIKRTCGTSGRWSNTGKAPRVEKMGRGCPGDFVIDKKEPTQTNLAALGLGDRRGVGVGFSSLVLLENERGGADGGEGPVVQCWHEKTVTRLGQTSRKQVLRERGESRRNGSW